MKPLTSKQVAEELGHKTEWIYANWRKLVRERAMPRPINGGGRGVELCWSAVQFYTWLDKDLPKTQRDQCAAFRAALIAARSTSATSHEAEELDKWTTHLAEKFGANA